MSPLTRPALALLAAGAVVAPTAAQAKPVKVTGQQTTLSLTGPAAKLLTDNGVSVAAVAPATLSGASATFPVTGGRVNAGLTKGFVRHAGAVTFTKDGRSLAVRRPVAVVTRRASFIAARSHGRFVRLFRLTDLAKTTSGTTTTITGQLRVTGRLASQLNRRLGTSVQRGAVAGTAETTLTTA